MDGEELGPTELVLEADDVPELLSSTDRFDKANKAFLDACVEHASGPCTETSEAIVDLGNEVLFSFRDSVATICETLRPDESITAIVNLIRDEHSKRIACFRELTPSKKFMVGMSQEGLQELFEQQLAESATTEEFTRLVVEQYSEVLQDEFKTFTKKVYKRYLAVH